MTSFLPVSPVNAPTPPAAVAAVPARDASPFVIPEVNEDEYRDRWDGDPSGDGAGRRDELAGEDGRREGDMETAERDEVMNDGRGDRWGERIRQTGT